MSTGLFSKALGLSDFASPIGQDRLIRKEVQLGFVRDIEPPQTHIGLQFAPFLEVAADDVIFQYLTGASDGLAPARAEDAEAELAQKDDLLYGQGRAAVIDWSLKDLYTASDVTRYREAVFLSQQLQGVDTGSLPLNFVGRTAEDFEKRIARHDALRRRKLDNRIEWMIMQAIENGTIIYNDGKIKFTVNYGRPAGQLNQAPTSGLWNTTTFDPIGDINTMNDTMFNTYGVRLKRGITSRRVLNAMWKSDRFVARTGLVVASGGTKIDPNYLIDGWGPDAAQAVVERATGVTLQVYDSVYRTRPIGSGTWTNNRFTSDNKIYFLPDPADLGEIDDTDIGFAKTLTAPHPEGNWSSGYYEWEDEKRDPWQHTRGSGIKAFPVFPYMEYTYTMTVL